jgi:hypothetical protein
MIEQKQFSALAEYIRMGWECATPGVVQQGLDQLNGTPHETKAKEARGLFDAFLATPKALRKVWEARQRQAREALEQLGHALEDAA